MSQRELELEVMRYDPEKDQAPWFQNYKVNCEEDWSSSAWRRALL